VIFLPFVALTLLIVGFTLVRQKERARRVQRLRRIAFVTAIFYAVIGTIFIIGETVTDPGGMKAVGLIALWSVPMLLVAALSWFVPRPMPTVMTVLVALSVGMNLWYLSDAKSWHQFENTNGPIRAVVLFALCVALGVYGYRRPGVAGVLLLVAALTSDLIANFSSHHQGHVSIDIVTAPAVMMGICYLICGICEKVPSRQNPTV
jgi:hypothetical protein